jgi:glucose/arabinose dehydrogenase
MLRRTLAAGLICTGLAAAATLSAQSNPPSGCEPGNGGLTLPQGFCASIYADNLGIARHMAVSPTGDLYVATRPPRGASSAAPGIVALRDANKDGKAEVVERIDVDVTTGVEWRDGHLYFSNNNSVSRLRMTPGQLKPAGSPEVIVSGLTDRRQHADKPFAFDEKGFLYVNIGAPSNTCQAEDRKPGSPGQKPCPILEEAAGIWRFSADKPGQTQKDGHRFATGIRNAVAITYNPVDKQIYIAQHGRDALDTLFPQGFTAQQNADLPAEELFRVTDGADFGWPYCYFDIVQQKKVLAPEYGGDGKQAGECAGKGQPLVTFPAHQGPNDVLFYTAPQFPAKYKNGAFVALHGSWNRAPFEMSGYRVVFVPFTDKGPTGKYEDFADGFAGKTGFKSPRDAEHRPTGLAVGQNGELFISDDVGGRIYRVVQRTGS